jgi:acyl phosphate:glycerol-3-phosphate acyltransferase
MLKLLLYILASYLLGSIPFSVLVGYAFAHVDVRTHGSGNAGATNVYRVAGPVAAVVAGLLDVSKGAVPVLVAKYIFPENDWLPLASGFAAMIGHIYPVFAGFKGGKGVNTLLGVFLVLLPLEIGVCLAIFGIVFALTRIVSLSSIMAGVSLSLIVLIEKYLMRKNVPLLIVSACIAVTLLLLFTHRANIRRLIKGEEKQLTR